MKKPVRIVGMLVGAATLITGVSIGATAETGPAPDSGFGHTEVRAGIPVKAKKFTLSSPDVREGGSIPPAAWANSFGCTGGNQQLRLEWRDAPPEARSFAVSMQDVDASTGSGFWHWMTWDIPATRTSLGNTPQANANAVSGTNDAGTRGYLGPCPPTGDINHRYKITVYALDVPGLDLAATSTPAVAAFTMSSHVIGYGRLTATARR
ncbi:YbhB/YbcL family Raf kinase inhibitor-like protein [Allokutzneria sp. A3M-2-11 16]|uniref:YbhB/YbcL family Raf kinase inhibitor-like protein n=1 Tax=Allokutzneria sp. A3M-2-11 16 TaxID=2962043 RepID=UPI0020B89F62|nr:YbhB/YbcL family Raf kinase inhibitor-like protein [Allokutzneria sp. A3M-2-11 16]MCP3804095.1 YbhB/YbcL family Raf kinase inhibitor-like protein [Allokutzneria sp. A3M-2-11 16]